MNQLFGYYNSNLEPLKTKKKSINTCISNKKINYFFYLKLKQLRLTVA
jgi:hypothetical protein